MDEQGVKPLDQAQNEFLVAPLTQIPQTTVGRPLIIDHWRSLVRPNGPRARRRVQGNLPFPPCAFQATREADPLGDPLAWRLLGQRPVAGLTPLQTAELYLLQPFPLQPLRLLRLLPRRGGTLTYQAYGSRPPPGHRHGRCLPSSPPPSNGFAQSKGECHSQPPRHSHSDRREPISHAVSSPQACSGERQQCHPPLTLASRGQNSTL